MRDAETVLSIIRERGKKGLPLERVYRHLFNPELYILAYSRIYSNEGAMTKGVTSETADGMSLAKIHTIIEALRYERYEWKPARRTYILKKNGKKRPLGIPTWSDKLVQEVLRLILEAYFEPRFSPQSHGFRPERGCHTALSEIQHEWTGVRWFLEGDIAQYFDTMDHGILVEILSETIHDGRFIQLISKLLKAGYLEEWHWNATLSGCPQGGVISPILSNLYLNKFDNWVETVLIPQYTKGEKRKLNSSWQQTCNQLYKLRKQGQRDQVKEVVKRQRSLPSRDPRDPNYRRLRYVRYADDTLFGFIGPKEEAEEIKRQIKEWLQANLKLELSEEKTLITNATQQSARFLGYEIINQQGDNQITRGKRAVNGRVGLRVPRDLIEKKCVAYMQQGKIIHRAEKMEESDFAIIYQYQQVYRGIVQYYLLAYDVSKLGYLHWVMRISLMKTLAAKYKVSMKAIIAKYQSSVQTLEGKTLRCLATTLEREGKTPLVARFGGISLKRQPAAILNDHPPFPAYGSTELVKRFRATTCELCGSREYTEVHHIRKLADLENKGGRETPRWKRRMAAMRRKTLVVCRTCHHEIHAGKYDKSIGTNR
ncbi:reverse transcriptase domain-containing protein [Ktedonospora formicarum]